MNDQMVMSLNAVSAVVEENSAATEEMTGEASELNVAFASIARANEANSAAREEADYAFRCSRLLSPLSPAQGHACVRRRLAGSRRIC